MNTAGVGTTGRGWRGNGRSLHHIVRASRSQSGRAARCPETVVFVPAAAYPAAAVHPDHRNVDSSRQSGRLLALLFVTLLLHAPANAESPPSPQVERGRELYGNMCAVCH